MSHSIRSSIDAGLRRRVQGIRGIIARTAPEGLVALNDELNEYDEGQGNGSRLRVADSKGELIHCYIEDLTFDHPAKFRLRVPHLVVKAADRSFYGRRMIVLDE